MVRAGTLAALLERPTLRHCLIGAAFALVAFGYSWPLFARLHHTGVQDWDVHLAYHAVPRISLLEYGEFPLWNPYHAGGLPCLANPQTRFLSPTVALVLGFGEVIGIKLDVLVHYWIGLVGSYLCGRVFDLDRASAVVVAFVYMLSGMLALSLAAGMTTFLVAAYLPWIFALLRRDHGGPRSAVLAGVCLALMLFGGGVHLVALAAVFLFVDALTRVLFRESTARAAWGRLATAAAVGLSISAIKVLPMLELMRRLGRTQNIPSGYSLQSLAYSLFSTEQSVLEIPLSIEHGFFSGISWGMDENGMYVGLFATALAVVGVVACWRRQRALLAAMVVMVWLSFGERAPLSAWSLLHELPVFEAMRVAQRFRYMWMLCFALFAGMGFAALRQRLTVAASPRTTAYATVLGLGVLLIDLARNSGSLEPAALVPPLPLAQRGEFRQIETLPPYDRTGWLPWSKLGTSEVIGSLYPAVLINIGSIRGYEPLADHLETQVIAAHHPEYRGEVYLKEGEGTVTARHWSPNRLAVDVETNRPSTVVFNQNYMPGWRAVAGVIDENASLIAVPVGPGKQRVEVYYRPASFVWGAGLSGVALAAAVIYVVRHRHWRAKVA